MTRFPLEVGRALLIPATLAGCGWFAPAPAPSYPHARYVLGGAYTAGDVWYYPSARFGGTETGLASILPDDHAPLTADGEPFDQAALATAHQTLQLPAVAELLNLENGRALRVRINDRGPASPARLVAVTRRVAALLGFSEAGVARVRLTLLEAPSRAAVEAVGGDPTNRFAVEAAPLGAVGQAELAPPAGATGAAAVRRGSPAAVSLAVARADAPPAPVPDTPAETVTRSAPEPGSLYVRLGRFSRREFADREAARVAALGPAIERDGTGQSATWRVSIGPLADVPIADGVLAQAIRAGILDARIVVE